jgi:membrane associated rhomboid family serine protease/antitoxin component YwqK of YwqJK toxin-antitoxin module
VGSSIRFFFSRYWLTALLAGLNILIFLACLFKGAAFWSPASSQLLGAGANFNPLTFGGEPFRLITAAFLHAGFVHLFVNIISLCSLGAALEARESRLTYLLLYFFSALGASRASSWYSLFTISVGASGAIFGLLGYFLVVNLLGVVSGTSDLSSLGSFIMVLAINLFLGFQFTFIDNAAHIGGLVTGALVYSMLLFLETAGAGGFKRHLIVLITWTGLLSGLYLMMPRYQVWYYNALGLYLHNEREANSLVNRTYPAKDQELASLYESQRIWEINQGLMRQNFDNMPASLRSDVEKLYKYAGNRRKLINLYLRSELTGNISLLDSVEYYKNKLSGTRLNHFSLVQLLSNDSIQPAKEKLAPAAAYYDKNWEETADTGFVYYRIGTKDSIGRWSGFIKDYYRDSTVQMKGDYRNDLKHGYFFYYYENGSLQSAGRYAFDTKVGRWQDYYPNGKLQSEMSYSGGGMVFLNYWDSLGSQLVKEGNGTYVAYYGSGLVSETGDYLNGYKDGLWKGFYSDGRLEFIEEYSSGRFIKGTRLLGEGKAREYTVLYKPPQPPEGMDAYRQYLKDYLKYPVRARQNKVEGLLWVEAEVDSAGNFKRLKPYNKLGYGCEEEAIRLVKEGPGFDPAVLRGVIIPDRTRIPVWFTLQTN